MTRARFHRFLETFVVVTAVVVLLACNDDKAEQKNVQESKAAISTSAAVLVDDYKNNEVSADDKYKGKVIEVTGVIDKIGKDITDTMYVSVGGGGQYELRSVQCFFADSEKGKLATLSKGQPITVKGQCDGLMMNVLLKGCVIER